MCLNRQGNTLAFRKAKRIWPTAWVSRFWRNSQNRLSMPKNEDVLSPHEQPWRQEVVSRVQQHRARRRRRLDPGATLELDFNAPNFSAHESSSPQTQLGIESESGQAFAPPASIKPETPKIIEFRRPVAVQPVFVPQDFVPQNRVEEFELAEPVLESPRILEAPQIEQMDLLPVFAGIELESAEHRPGDPVELPPQSAGLQLRAFASLVDLLIVLVASAAFAMISLVLIRDLPQPRTILLTTAAVSALLWLVYQYLFLVYSAGTPGMQMAQLELCTFQGKPVSASLRRWRALASLLSCCSLGLGFAWALIDEDMLGWHDRITQTHVRGIH
jgi:uncharacterized RDD family membrane protein YckC